MNKVIMIIIALTALTSCWATKRTRAETRTIDKVEVAQSDIQICRMSTDTRHLVSWDSVWHNMILQFRIYDTTNPDSSGVCPVVMDGTLTSSGGELATTEVSKADSVTQCVIVESKDSTEVKADEEIYEVKEQETEINWLTKVGMLSMIIVLLLKLSFAKD